MLRALNHAAHLLGEAVLGAIGILTLGGCLLAWRLSQGPLDVTALVEREGRLLNARGSHVAIGSAQLAWEGLSAPGARLDVIAQDVVVRANDGAFRVGLKRARVALSVPELLLGRIAPRQVLVDSADVVADLTSAGAGQGGGGAPAWLRQLQRVTIRHSALILRGALPGTELHIPQAELDLTRSADGLLAGDAHLALEAGDARSVLNAHAAPEGAATRVTAATDPVSPASLAMLVPALAGLRALDAPMRLDLRADIGPGFTLDHAVVGVDVGAGIARAGSGSVGVAGMTASLVVTPAEYRLEGLRIRLAAVAGLGTSGAAPPVISGSATATMAGRRFHATFGVDISPTDMADLAWYWPDGTGGGARDWLVQNVPAGLAHDAQVSGSLDGNADLSDVALTSLSGGVAVDDGTVFWLRPIPGLEHAQARVTVEGPDALRVVMTKGGQNNIALRPGSSIRITGLSAKDQFGDIDAGLSGALPDALGLLNHPRLALLSRGGLDVVGARGQARAKLKMHVPLEDWVAIDDITVAATADLHGVHLSGVAGGRDLDDGELAVEVGNDGLSASGTGTVSGIAARLAMAMDFRDGPPQQVLQHVTATGSATPAGLAGAGLPENVTGLLTDGSAGLSLDYAARRDGTAILRADADLGRAGVTTPLGWSKPAGEPATIGGAATLSHGRLMGVDHLHAEGPGLALVSTAQFRDGARSLAVERLRIGRTDAHGRVDFPASGRAPVEIALAGDTLDLSSQLDPPKSTAAKPPVEPPPGPPADEDTPGQAWAARLDFAHVQLSRGRTLSPLHLDAASDGLRVLHAQLRAGSAGEIVASVTPEVGGRALSVSAADAGVALRALGIADNLAGGRLQLSGRYDDTQPGSPLSGTATLTEFNLRDAPAIGRLLQAMTLYGLTDLVRGPGLHFSKMVAPFRWHRRVLSLKNARAFSPSLGITAQGDLDVRRHVADVSGTVVPAYFFNQLLGDLPLVGKIFSPEKGGGLFAARYSVRGPLADPKVGVNPLSALTPGFLREGFGLFSPSGARR